MKWCSKCECEYEDTEEVCSVCGDKLVDYGYKIMKTLFSFLALVGVFITASFCGIIPIILVIVGVCVSSLNEGGIEILSTLEALREFYTAPFYDKLSIPTYVIVIIFLCILLVGIIGNLIVNKKIKKLKK